MVGVTGLCNRNWKKLQHIIRYEQEDLTCTKKLTEDCQFNLAQLYCLNIHIIKKFTIRKIRDVAKPDTVAV